jgi:hypothetical protein
MLNETKQIIAVMNDMLQLADEFWQRYCAKK